MKAGIEDLVVHLQQAQQIVLITHIKPDGDALGSMLGLADILRQMEKSVLCYLEEPVPHLYRFLPGWQQAETSFAKVEEFVDSGGQDVLAVVLDCGDMARLGKKGPQLRKIHPFVVIDHHKGNNGFGDLSWVEPGRSSTAEMICDLAGAMGQHFSPAAATCLYAAIATDTGSFRYESTSSHTYRVVARLVDCGAQPGDINEKLYDSYSLGRLQLLQQVLATLEFFADDRVAVISVSESMMADTGTTLEDTEDFINLPRVVESVQVAVFLKEGSNSVSVSLRSRGNVDVSQVAQMFGGGGHARASGFRQNGLALDAVRASLLPALVKELDC